MKREYTDQTRGQIQDVFNLPRYENLETLADNMLDAEERRLAAENVETTIEMGLEDEYVEMGGDSVANVVKEDQQYVEMGGDGDVNVVKEDQSEHGGENHLKAQEDDDDIEEPRDEGVRGDGGEVKKRYNCTENHIRNE